MNILKPESTLNSLRNYLSKVPPVGDFATAMSITPLAVYTDNFYPSKGFTDKMDKIEKIAQSFGDPGLESQIAPNMGALDLSMQNAVRSIVDKTTNFTDGNDLTTMMREAIRMQFVTAIENILPDKSTLNPKAHIEPMMDRVNSQMLTSVIASLDTLQMVDNQMSRFKTGTINQLTDLVDVMSQVAPNLVPAVLDVINLTESYFQLANIMKELVAVAKMNEQPASQITNSSSGMVSDMSGIIPMNGRAQNSKMSVAQVNQAILNISDMLLQSSVVNINGQNVYTIDKNAVDNILYSYATDDDLMDLQALANGQDIMRNPLDMYNTIVAYNNAVPIENENVMVLNPWFQLMLLTVARLQGQAVSQSQNVDLMIATADAYNAISIYSKIRIESNSTSIEECLRTDISMGSKIATLSIAHALNGNTSLINFANKFLGTDINGVSKLNPQNMVNSMRMSNATFNPSRVTQKDIENWLGLSGVASNIMPDEDIKNDVIGSISNIIKEIKI